MKLEQLLDGGMLHQHLVNGLVDAKSHPTLPLVIYNYTKAAAYTKPPVWGDDCIDYCRGLITHRETGEIIARPFKKFHNLNSPDLPDTLMENIIVHFRDMVPVVTEKMDGSLGIYYRLGEDWGVATRGSFKSDQALWATEWYRQRVTAGTLSPFGQGEYTPLFEIIYRMNQIVVVDYKDFEGLVLLAMVNKTSGSEATQEHLLALGERRGFVNELVVKSYPGWEDGKKWGKTLPKDEGNREGYVLSWANGDATPFKVKVKFQQYRRLSRVISALGSPKAIWEIMASGHDIEVLDALPLRFRNYVNAWRDMLVNDYERLYSTAKTIFDNQPVSDHEDFRAYKKHTAEYFIRVTAELPLPQDQRTAVLAVLFSLRNDNPAQTNQLIWKLIKPRGDDQTFKSE